MCQTNNDQSLDHHVATYVDDLEKSLANKSDSEKIITLIDLIRKNISKEYEFEHACMEVIFRIANKSNGSINSGRCKELNENSNTSESIVDKFEFSIPGRPSQGFVFEASWGPIGYVVNEVRADSKIAPECVRFT